ncbi:type I DNA topoisomerase [Candidatus Sumerlaeota bacterium]|nr:type I DNA topoisomerase [Candidatus Sumerlaeota bacterium]
MSPTARKSLVIVESPAKAKTIEKYLGKDFIVEASMGHVMDLPRSSLGLDPDKDMTPEYVVIEKKDKFINKIKKAARTAKAVYLAPDPDREGEAIAWHIASVIKDQDIVYRATFNEITRDAVRQAIENPGRLNKHLFEAQQARRVLDRLVGYKISPLLWNKIQRGLSAGRVQSVAVRMIVEREAEIKAFEPVEYWTIDALVCRTEEAKAKKPHYFKMRLAQIDGKKAEIGDEKEAAKIREEALKADWIISKIVERETKRSPAAPFITSTLQQEAARKLHFSAKQTMMLAQRLYEGIEIDESEGESVGFITYMRTDSTRVADEATKAARKYISEKYGKEYAPAKTRVYKTKKGAQDAHEAIRPTSMEREPESVRETLEAIDKKLYKLYVLIWNRFVASQMADATFDSKRIEAMAGKRLLFRASGQTLKFPGFLAVYEEGIDEAQSPEDADPDAENLPMDLAKGGALTQKESDLMANQHFTKPPPQFTEATLVKELESQGIGRPSTYASIISVIQDRKFVNRDQQKRFSPTPLGKIITEMLTAHFSKILDVKFTALMEEQLDDVETGKVNWSTLVENFWREFKVTLEAAQANMRNLKREVEKTDEKCDKCGEGTMVIRWGRNGRFLACDQYPKCRNTRPYLEDGEKPQELKFAKQLCGECGAKMYIKTGKWGRFAACSRYPDCKTIEPLKTMVKCPEDGCDGDLVERTSKRGKVFYSCTNYPKCEFVSWEKPMPFECPGCKNPHLLQGRKGGKGFVHCPKCDYYVPLDDFLKEHSSHAHDEEGGEEA